MALTMQEKRHVGREVAILQSRLLGKASQDISLGAVTFTNF
jgi:hypothetical protein